MDKNKAAYKLQNLPPLYYINLDDKEDRRKFMEDQFAYWQIENYERISAYDGREDDLSDILKGRYPDNMMSGEVGCVTSHLKAIKHWYDTSDSPVAMIMEDDCVLDTVKYWGFTWSEFMSHMPYDWDMIQLAIINPGAVHVQLHQRFCNDFSTACYIITRHHAERLFRYHLRGEKYKLDNGVKPRAVADDLLYNSGVTYSIPLFLYQIDLGSDIHTDHVDVFHKSSYNGILQFWQNVPDEIANNWGRMFQYNPFLRLPPEVAGK
jgi:GR25 family glycosyltransferase involved in LPS biosynthesis